MSHTIKIELRGDCYQQRIFDLSNKAIAQKCRGYIFRGDLEDMISAVSEEQFGEYVEELNYCTEDNDMNVTVWVDGEVLFDGDIFELVNGNSRVSAGLGDIDCLVEQISKDVVFYTKFKTEEDFFVEKIQVLSDDSDNHFLGNDKLIVSHLRYDGKDIELDEDSDYNETIYGFGAIDNDGNISCEYELE